MSKTGPTFQHEFVVRFSLATSGRLTPQDIKWLSSFLYTHSEPWLIAGPALAYVKKELTLDYMHHTVVYNMNIVYCVTL